MDHRTHRAVGGRASRDPGGSGGRGRRAGDHAPPAGGHARAGGVGPARRRGRTRRGLLVDTRQQQDAGRSRPPRDAGHPDGEPRRGGDRGRARRLGAGGGSVVRGPGPERRQPAPGDASGGRDGASGGHRGATPGVRKVLAAVRRRRDEVRELRGGPRAEPAWHQPPRGPRRHRARPATRCAKRHDTGRGPSPRVHRRRALRRLHELGRRTGDRALPAPGRGGDRALQRQQRGARHADRLGEVPRRGGRAFRRPGRRPDDLLHRPDQGARLGEVLRAVRRLRGRQRRHADRRRVGQPGCPDHLLHRGGPREHRAARGCGGRRGPGGDGRVPLLRRRAAWVGLAGAAPHPARCAVRADVGDARRHVRDRRGPRSANGARDGRHRQRRATRCR